MWIWFNLEPEKLPASLGQAFEAGDSEFSISAVSVWEAMVAMEKGRVTAALSPEITVRAWLQGNPFRIVQLDEEIAMLARTLPFNHDDPADRFIAATSYRLMCPLATVDDRLRKLEWLNVFG